MTSCFANEKNSQKLKKGVRTKLENHPGHAHICSMRDEDVFGQNGKWQRYAKQR